MTLLLKILAVGLVHMALFAAFPGTGPYGNYYLCVSLLVWSVFIIFINTSTKLVNLVSGIAGAAVNLAAFALMAVAIAATMPQSDGVSALRKLQARRYPDTATVKSGLLRFGVRLDDNVNVRMKDLDGEVNKAIKKLKEDQ